MEGRGLPDGGVEARGSRMDVVDRRELGLFGLGFGGAEGFQGFGRFLGDRFGG